MAPFLFENWFRYRLRFCKMLNFRFIFSFGLPIGCQKVSRSIRIPVSTGCFLKRALEETNGLDIGCKLSLL